MNNRVKSAKTKPAEREQYGTIPSFYRKTLIYLPVRQIYQGELYDHLNLRRQIKQWFTDTNIVMIHLYTIEYALTLLINLVKIT